LGVDLSVMGERGPRIHDHTGFQLPWRSGLGVLKAELGERRMGAMASLWTSMLSLSVLRKAADAPG
jgi:hypothetical protein